MGDPKKQRKKYTPPRHPWQKLRIEEEGKLIKDYGLKNKTEIWKMSSYLKNSQRQAKTLIVAVTAQAEKEKTNLLQKLKNVGLINETATIDDILGLSKNAIFDRRLQTLVVKKGLARTMKQARQFIVHGHITVKERRITSPGYIVCVSEESAISFLPKSSLANAEHPERVVVGKSA